MQNHKTISNPDLTVGKNNKQSWNQAENRRSGFHNVHSKFRRALMIRSRNVLVLKQQSVYKFRFDADLEELLDNKAFSAMCCIKHDNIANLYEVIDTPNQVYLVMELCHGKSL